MPILSDPNEGPIKAALGEGKVIKVSDGKRQYGHVVLRIEPNAQGRGIEVRDEIVGGSIPAEFIQPVMNGVREGLWTGESAADIIVRLVGGSYHESDSTALSFKLAGLLAAKDALRNGGRLGTNNR